MATKNYRLDIVSIEKQIFSGLVNKIQITGGDGELEIFSRHAPLITIIKAGIVYIVKSDGNAYYIHLSGGILEVQPSTVIILGDDVVYFEDFDKTQLIALKNKKREHKNIFY